jgi:hypothetical protein
MENEMKKIILSDEKSHEKRHVKAFVVCLGGERKRDACRENM